MNKSKKAAVILGVVLLIVYFSLMRAAANGYGYMGYRGYHSGPSFWYFGGTNSYYDRSYRSGQHSGGSFRGGGPGSGK